MVLIPVEQGLDEGLVGIVAKLLGTIDLDGLIDEHDDGADGDGCQIAHEHLLADEEAVEGEHHYQGGAEDEQTAVAPRLLEIQEVLLLVQVFLEVFFFDAVALNLRQGRVVLMIHADVPDAALKGVERLLLDV